jgi:hypothetical protein
LGNLTTIFEIAWYGMLLIDVEIKRRVMNGLPGRLVGGAWY